MESNFEEIVNNNQSSNEMSGGEFTTCSRCNHPVPTANLMVHEANCSRRRQVTAPVHEPLSAPSESPENNSLDLAAPSAPSLFDLQEQQETPPSQLSATNEISPLMEEELPLDDFIEDIDDVGVNNSVSTPGPSSREVAALIEISNSSGGVPLQPGQWQCGVCTLINESHSPVCDACLGPRGSTISNMNTPTTTRSPDLVRTDTVADNGWVNVSYNPQFRRGLNSAQRNANGLVTVTANANNRTYNFQNPMQGTGTLSTATRVFNGLVNGAMIGK